jgi:hypothetical protein
MTTIDAALLVGALLAFSLAGSYWLIDRAQRRESVRDRLIREGRERAEFASIADPYTLAATDPELAARLDQLRDDIRAEQQGGGLS